MKLVIVLNPSQVMLKSMPRSEREKLAQLLTPKMTPYIPHKPYPKQAAFMLLACKEAFYGGSAGGGKSDALLMCALQYVDVPGYSAIIFRKSFADLIKPGALIDRALTWLAPYLQTKEVKWVDKEKKFVFPSGAILQFGYLENPKDRFNYQGGEYQFIGFDEVTHMAEVSYRYMFSRLRKLKGHNVPLRVRAASNPPDDDDGGAWVYDRFVNPATKKPHVVFIPAGLNDNPYLDKEAYLESLEELDPVTRARLRDGLWEIVRKGNMFKRDWYEVVDEAPRFANRVRFWDCAATEVKPHEKKKGKDPDYTVGFKMSEYQGIYYIEDIVHVQVSALDVETLQKNTAITDGYLTQVREEEEGGSSGKYAIQKKKKEIFDKVNYKGVHNSTNKITRAMPVSAASERGVIKIVRGCRNIEAFFNEIEGFPAGRHDDLVDGFSGAFNALNEMPKSSAPVGVTPERKSSYWGFENALAEEDTRSYWRS